MTIGTRHVLVGTLRMTLLGHVLEAEGRGWRLDIGGATAPYVGRRVRVEGVRTGRDRLTVERLTVDEPPPMPEVVARGPWRRLAAMLHTLWMLWRGRV